MEIDSKTESEITLKEDNNYFWFTLDGEKKLFTENFTPQKQVYKEKLIVKNSDFAYQHKFEDRSCFEPVAPKLCDYLYHKEGVVKESSIANIAFFDGKQWETALFPYLKGTTRARYIASGWLVEKHITLDDLVKYKKVAMMNAMVGFVELGKCSDILSHKA